MTGILRYRRPERTIVVHGSIDDKVIKSLNDVLRQHGARGLRIYLLSESNSPRLLEQIRDFLQSNHAFTVEVYIVSKSEMENLKVSQENTLIVSSGNEGS